MTATTASAPTFAWRAFLQRYGLLLILGVLVTVISLREPRFLSVDNAINILRQATDTGIIAIGMMLVILTRGIDLSVGSILAVTTLITADQLRSGLPALPALLVCLGIGALLGLVNGLLVSRVGIPPFIATLGMMVAGRGLALQISGGKPISELGEDFRQIGTGFVGAIPIPVIIVALIVVAGFILLNYTVLGRRIFALGDNERAAFLTGIPVKTIQTLVYVISGALASLAGAILMARLGSAPTNIGEGIEFDAIAAVVVGGTSFAGGEGTIWGTVLGVLIIEVLNSGINVLNISSYTQGVVQGVVIALALLLHRALR
jgi:ribose/xylose/arabinose/galactoside ABC-type transport system permease subunit